MAFTFLTWFCLKIEIYPAFQSPKLKLFITAYGNFKLEEP